MYKPYLPERFSTNPRYPFKSRYGLCRNCGFPQGQHFNKKKELICPNPNQVGFGLTPEFYRGTLNKNIKIL